MRGRTTLVVAHRLTQARLADRVLVMHDGAIVEDGTHDQLLALDGRYSELWGAWSECRWNPTSHSTGSNGTGESSCRR